MTINISERLRAGRKAEQDKRAGDEIIKRGNLRAGMTGILAETGDVAGVCVRKSHLRQLGIELETPDENKLIMFELGFASEDITYEVLQRSLQPGEIMLREEEIPIEWLTKNGTKITGRPDIVICTKSIPEMGPGKQVNIPVEGGLNQLVQPILGLELKSVHSIWTARDVLFGGQPKLGNLAQAAHYMWKLDVPYKLIYKSYSQLGQSMSDWATKFFPQQGQPNSQYVDYNSKGGIKGLKQFEIVYDLMVDTKGRVCYKLEADTEWNRSIITTQDIERYYEFVSTMGETKTLGPRPMTIDAHGEKLNYKECAYCPVQKHCDAHESAGYDTWLNEIRKETK